MDIPRGHAAMPLNEADFMDFVYNYFKAEYAPIRSFWSTATADPREPSRWFSMGNELQPLRVRPANAQAQKDLESLDYFTRKWNLDAGFIRGIVTRFAKYEVHERLEKKLYECARLDLMVRKALKEKHLIDALWPSPAPRNLPQELLAQGVQVRKWYGDMFTKYFRVLHSIDEFTLRPEVDAHIKNSTTLMLVPFVDHLIFGAVDPIMPIVAKGAGYSNAKGWRASSGSSGEGFGEPGRFEIRFDAPANLEDTFTKSVIRQCQCNKCGTKRDVQVVVSVDPTPGGGSAVAASSRRRTSGSSTVRREASRTQKYAPGYSMPGQTDAAPPKPPRPQVPIIEPVRAPRPEQKKQCPRCTFLNHPELTACEICQADLPASTISKPPSPKIARVSHSHSASVPPAASQAVRDEVERPGPPNRHSLSSTLFSIFSQQQQQEHAHLPISQQAEVVTAAPPQPIWERKEVFDPSTRGPKHPPRPSSSRRVETQPSELAQQSKMVKPSTTPPPPQSSSAQPPHVEPETPLSRAPEMAMMAMTPPPTNSAQKRAIPAGLPSNLMDDFVPVSPGFVQEDDEEDAGWGEMSKEEAKGHIDDADDDEDEGDTGVGLIDLDAVAREEADVWGDREED